MIIVDTNVVSELIRQTPDANVLSWLDALPTEQVVTTTITAAELFYGVARLPDAAGRPCRPKLSRQ